LGTVEDVCELAGLTFRLWSECLRGEELSWLPEAAARWA
jgi:hypothetical protein